MLMRQVYHMCLRRLHNGRPAGPDGFLHNEPQGLKARGKGEEGLRRERYSVADFQSCVAGSWLLGR